MLITHSRFRSLRLAASVASGTLFFLACIATGVSAQVLVGNPYVTGFQGWQSTYVPADTQVGEPPAWGVLVTPDPLTGQRFLMETSDGREADATTTAGVADGMFKPYILIDSLVTTPANYNITYNLATMDNDGFGVVFGYQDNDNYFRASFREQASGNLGFQQGTSVQKVVNGVITQLATSPAGFVPVSTGTPFDAKVVVSGANWDVQVNNVSILNGSDADLQPGKYGVHSWAQNTVAGTVPTYGTIVRQIVLDSTIDKTTDFANLASPIAWRRLVMTNAAGETGFETGTLQRHGNFAHDFINGTIRDDSNGNTNAVGAPNIDFMGPAIVVDSAGSAAMTDYRFTTRVENRDNDGIGVMLRVADDNTFYRINWATEGPGTGTARPPLGMSIQKYSGFLWSEVYRDDPNNPAFLPGDTPFDLSVQVVGDTFKIDVLDDPDGEARVISYAPIQDASGAILNGSVGFTNWGNGGAEGGAIYSAFRGDGTSLVNDISAFTDFDLTVNRTSGNVTLRNNNATSAGIKEVSIVTGDGSLNPLNWLSITDNYDQAPQNGSVDSDDPWTELTATDFELTEREQSGGGNGGILTAGEVVNLGNIWRKSRLENLTLEVELTDGQSFFYAADFTLGPDGTPYERSDLNTDGSINTADWLEFFPDMLTDISTMTNVQQVLAGDLDLDGDNDVNDFILFKSDYETANGAGSFNAMIAAVPEPSTIGLLLVAAVGACGLRFRHRCRAGFVAAGMIAIGLCGALFATGAKADTFAAQIDGTTGMVLHQTVGSQLFVGTQPAGDVGDLSLLLGGSTVGGGGTPFLQANGVILAAPNQMQYGAVGDRNTVEVPGELSSSPPAGFPTGMWLSTANVSGAGVETNSFRMSMTHLPFADRWNAGHVNGTDGTFLAGNTSGVTVTTQFNATFGNGHYELSINGIDSRRDGMLFAVGAEDSNSGNVIPVGILPDGSGWNIRVNDQGNNFPATEQADWSFVYVPYDSRNLVAAGELQLVSAELDGIATVNGVGTFTASRVDLGVNGAIAPPTGADGLADAGRFLITIPGKTDATGMLMIGTSAYASAGGNSGADDNLTVWEYNAGLGGFLVESYDLTGASLQNSDIYFAYYDYAAPIEAPPVLTIEVDRGDGTITLINDNDVAVGFDYYQIDSAAGSLNEAGWDSLDEKNFQSDGGGPGQSFNEAGGSSDNSLAEAFLLTEMGFPELAANSEIELGAAYDFLMNSEDLQFKFKAASGFVHNGIIEYIGTAPGGLTGDYNGDGTVNAADYTVWRNNLNGTAVLPNDSTPGTVTAADYNVWRANFGNSGSGSGSGVVPEPTSLALLTCVGLLLGVRRCSRRNV